MGLSKRHLNTNPQPVEVDLEQLGRRLQDAVPQVVFALVLGSSRSGVVPAYGDLDLAVYLNERASLRLLASIAQTAEEGLHGVRCDLGVLNGADPVYRWEACHGSLLFVRDQETWLRFFSLTAREYEEQMHHYKRQRRYRLEAGQAARPD